MKEHTVWQSVVCSVRETDDSETVEITIQGRVADLDADVREQLLDSGVTPTKVSFDVGADDSVVTSETESGSE